MKSRLRQRKTNGLHDTIICHSHTVREKSRYAIKVIATKTKKTKLASIEILSYR